MRVDGYTAALVVGVVLLAPPDVAGVLLESPSPLLAACKGKPGEQSPTWQSEIVQERPKDLSAELNFSVAEQVPQKDSGATPDASGDVAGGTGEKAEPETPPAVVEHWVRVPKPTSATSAARRLFIRQSGDHTTSGLFSITAYLSGATVERATATFAPVGPKTTQVMECFSTDSASASPHLLLPADFDGIARVTRLDPPTAGITVSLEEEEEQLRGTVPVDSRAKAAFGAWFAGSVSRGHALRMTITAAHYKRLVDVARCGYLSAIERPLSDVRQPGGKVGCETHAKDAHVVYDWLSAAMGRHTTQEFLHMEAAKTEPIIAFIGLANLNHTLLLDCRHIKDGSCERFSEPWQASLERAEYAWAVYLEESLRSSRPRETTSNLPPPDA